MIYFIVFTLFFYYNPYNIYSILILLEYYNLILVYLYYNSYRIINLLYYIIYNGLATISLMFYLYNIYLFNKINSLFSLTLAIKFSLYPFILIVISIYQYLSYYSILILSILPKVLFIILYNNFYYLFNQENNILILTSLVLLLFYKNNNFKVLLLISSIINMTYIILIKDSYMLYLFTLLYIINLGSLFLILGNYNRRMNSYISFVLFTYIGVPPFIGFINKVFLIITVIMNHQFIYLISLLLVIIISSLIYLSMIIRVMNFKYKYKEIGDIYYLLSFLIMSLAIIMIQ